MLFEKGPSCWSGAGYAGCEAYLDLSDGYKALASPILPQQNECGVELFYNFVVNPSSRLTTDLQIANPSTQRFDTVIIPGLRLELLF